MKESIEVSRADLDLILEALEEASFFRDARSRVLDSAVRRSARRHGRSGPESNAGDEHRRKVETFSDLAARLKAAMNS